MKIDIKKYHSRYFHFLYAMKTLRDIKGSILDVGCGMGQIANEIKKSNPDLKVFACDKDESVLSFAKKNYGVNKIVFSNCDAHKLHFSDKKFDAVIMTDVLEHLENPQESIKEIRKVLKKNGVFHLVVPCEASLFTIDGWIKKLFGKNLKERPIGHIQQFNLKDIKKMLTNDRFELRHIKYSYHLFYQFFSLIYYLYVSLFNKGKYLPLESTSQRKTFNKAVFYLKIIGGYLVFLESIALADFRGQTAHITAKRL